MYVCNWISNMAPMESWHFLRHYAKLQHAHMYDQLGIVIPFCLLSYS